MKVLEAQLDAKDIQLQEQDAQLQKQAQEMDTHLKDRKQDIQRLELQLQEKDK